jgi:LemA protein
MKNGKMTSLLIGLVVVVAIAVICAMYAGGTYNGMVKSKESVNETWAQVENVYQRRLDLIPNLVETVKGYAAHEQETLTAVVEARSKATQTKVDAGNIDNVQQIKQFMEAQEGLSSALSRLMVVVERYPDLKANQNFLALQSQLEGTENRIAVERRRFNEAVKIYNTGIKLFPKNMLAGVFGFEAVAYFEAEKEAATAPKVQF